MPSFFLRDQGVPSPDRSSSASWSAGRSRGRRREASPRTPIQVGARMRARGRPCRLQTRRGPRALVPREASRSGLSGGSEAGNPLTQSPRARPGTRNVSPSVHLPSFGGKLGTGHGLGEPLKPPPALSASLWPASPGPVQPCPARCISRLGSLCRHLHQPRPHAPCSLPSSSLGGPLASPPLSTSAWCLWSARLQVLPAPPHVLRLCSRRLALPQPRTCLRATAALTVHCASSPA